MLKPGKIRILAVCTTVLTLLMSCAVVEDPAPVEPDPAPLETTADQFPETLPDAEQDGQELAEEPVEEPIEEPVEEPNPIPFFVPDTDPDDTDPVQTPEPVRISVPIPYITTENPAPAVSRKVSDPDRFGDDILYFGRWSIQSRGIDVACYLGWSQDTVDAEDAATFFQYGDQYIIGDHKNQDFEPLGSCQPGDLACLETEDGIAIYVCTAIVQGHNTAISITDEAWNPIEYGFNTGGITCYTCIDDWQNIYLVLFSPIA